MTITNDDLATLRRRGFEHLIPLDENKQPIGSWKFNEMGEPESGYKKFPDADLLAAPALGENLEADRINAVDLDALEARTFEEEYPETFTTYSKGKGVSQLLYKLADDVEPEHYSLPKKNSAALAQDGTILENIAKTQSFLLGINKIISRDVPLKVLDKEGYAKLHRTNKKVYALSMLKRLYPKKETFRDDFRLTLAGTLHLETDWSDNEKKQFVKALCKAAGDKAVNKALEKLGRVKKNIERNIKEGKEPTKGIWATNNLSKLCNRPGIDGGLDFIDAIRSEKRQQELDNKDDEEVTEDKIDYSKRIAFCDVDSFRQMDFPKPSYLLEPLVSKQSIVQVVGASGVGKTMLGLSLAGAMATCNGFLGMPSVGGATPVLYVEGELPASDIQIRINGMLDAIGKRYDANMFFVSSLQQQLKINDKGFTPIQTEQGLIEIENAIVEIKKRTGKMPVLFIDNISCLAGGLKENDADAWSPIINKFVKWKNMGSTVIYFHHLNKGNDSSGSTMQHRTIDMVIRMRKPDNKQKIKTFEDKGVQAIVDFPKWRLHDNSKYAQEHMLICEDWKWQKMPVLTSAEASIIQMFNEGLDVKEMSKQIDLAEKTIYKKIKKLKDEGVIIDDKVDRQTTDSATEDIC